MQQQDSKIPKFIRQISVVGLGEVSSPPDCHSFQVCIRSSKENIDDVKNSVTRRLSYIEQVVKNCEFNKETKLEVYKTFSREEKLNTLVADIKLTFSNLKTCDELRNLLIEKLDSNAVDVGPVQLYHSLQNVEKLRLSASLLAIDNAKKKASAMAETMNQYLGRPLMVHEEKTHEWFGLLPNSSPEKEFNSFRQQQIKLTTKNVKCEIHAQFELLPKDQI
ncbi:unnamed protein product [Acanthosepion pharaonis]|uniref:Interleukin-1 receptor-associated kinase 1-binding protein 1 n=1 Tax=Acanthosepion pharaonis TaxID=158019 RepID=A0A812BFC7_ACAPH|nr:unnamed protein product [Sepia pharaonis]